MTHLVWPLIIAVFMLSFNLVLPAKLSKIYNHSIYLVQSYFLMKKNTL